MKLNRMEVTSKTTVKEMKAFLTDFFSVAKFNDEKSPKLASVRDSYNGHKKSELLEDIEMVDKILDRLEANAQKKATEKKEAPAPSLKPVETAKKEATAPKKEAPKKESKPAWELPKTTTFGGQLFELVETNEDNILSFLGGEMVTALYISKSQFGKDFVYDSMMSKSFNDKVMKDFPFNDNVEIYQCVAHNDLQMVFQSLNTATYTRYTPDELNETLKDKQMGIYKLVELMKPAQKKRRGNK